jgi:phospholipase/carboxylesterase
MATSDEITEQRTDANAHIPIWVAHGIQDDVVPITLGQQAMADLEAMNYRADWVTYPMGHEVVLEEIDALGGWLKQQLAG